MKIIIAGSRGFTDYELLTKKLNYYFQNIKGYEIISGMARGADALGALYAIDNEIPLIEMPANWDLHGNSAGYIRNIEMADIADALVVFWDGRSKGTYHMIKLAQERNLKIKIVKYSEPAAEISPQGRGKSQ